jgi:hypothetical protein
MGPEASAATFRSHGRLWLRDFDIGLTGLTVRKTGARVPYTPSVIAEVWAWFRFFFVAHAIKPLAPPFSIAFYPERARPWYMVWAVSRAAGARAAKTVADADVVMHFEDATFSPNDPPATLKPGARLINFNCQDVSKSRVADASEQAFGHKLHVDPATHFGPAVEKSEINGAHDGRVVQCPTEKLPGRVYQRLIDSRGPDPDIVDDLRTVIVGGRAIVVFIKRRPVTKRFQNTNSEVLLRMPEDIFQPEELAQITEFSRRIGLDWGGVDVLRDRTNGNLHIVDANKTDMGPPIALSLADKMRATRLLARAFREFALREAH